MFQLSEEEVAALVSLNVIPSRRSLGGYLPYAFTQEGVAMLSSVLRSEPAVQLGPLTFSAIPIVLCLLLYRGYSWVRYYVVFSNSIYAIFLCVSLFQANTPLDLSLRAVWATICLTTAMILWRSKSVKAYFDHQSRTRYAIPSIRK